MDYPIRAFPLLVESILGPDWFKGRDSVGPGNARRAWRISCKALFWGRRFPNYLPHAWRVRGRAAFAIGRRQKAIRYFAVARAAAEAIGARYDLARTHLDLARIAEDSRDENEERGHQILSDIGAAIPQAEA
jgi:hypothetical protein